MTMILDGTQGITFPDTSKQYNSYYSFKNRIINGAMVIDQRNAGASKSNFNALYLTDRFLGQTYRSSATAQQVTDAPTGFSNSLKFTNDSTGAAPGASSTLAFIQALEGFNVADLGLGTASAQAVTLSFWVKASVTGTYGVGFCNDGAQNWFSATRSYVATYTVNAANTWEYKTVTVTLDTSGSWNKTTGVGLAVVFDLGSGSNFNTTAGAWATGAFARTSGCVTIGATANATWQVTGVQLEKGIVATSFDYRPYGTELALCQRYYQVTDTFWGVSSSSTVAYATTNFQVSMRAAPSLSAVGILRVTDGYSADFNQSSGSAVINSSRVSANGVSFDAANFSGMTTGRAFFARQAATANIALNAEL